MRTEVLDRTAGPVPKPLTGLGAGPRVNQWKRRTECPLAALAVLFLGGYAWPIVNPHLDAATRHGCRIVVYAAWAAFGVDYLCRLLLAERRRWFIWHNLLDLASLALPVLRPLRLLRLIALIRVVNRKTTASLHGRVAIYVSVSAVLLVFVASLAVLDAERGRPHANINTFGDALWWSATTVMTVGYGDRFPVTTSGRFIAVGLMIGGITLLGIVTASIASWLIARVRDEDASTEARINTRIDELSSDIAELKMLLTRTLPEQPADADPAQALPGFPR